MRFIVALLLVALGALCSAQAPLDPVAASRYFQEAKWASDDDGGRLWGKRLYGPMLFVDPQTRSAVANQADAQGKLTKQGDVWVGVLPAEVPVANTAMEWAGVKWTMVMWDALDIPQAVRIQLMMHECWHRIQDSIGLPAARVANAHLDTEQGRVWLRLEWRALSAALLGLDRERTKAIGDALVFRAYRRSLFLGSGAEEDRMEVHEGLAEYTGIRLMGLGDWSRGAYVAGRMKMDAVNRPSYPLSFAYDTGPAYGILLDDTGKEWRSSLSPQSSLSGRLAELSGVTAPADLAAEAKKRALAYDGKALMAEEHAREVKRKADEVKWRKLLVEGPVLEVPIPNQGYTYDPNNVFLLGKDGSVFPESHIADDWGVLEVKNGARLVSADRMVYVAAPSSPNRLSNENWVLTLKAGWKLVPGARKGDYRIVRG